MASASRLVSDYGCSARMELRQTGLENKPWTFQRGTLSLSLLLNLGCFWVFGSCSRFVGVNRGEILTVFVRYCNIPSREIREMSSCEMSSRGWEWGCENCNSEF